MIIAALMAASLVPVAAEAQNRELRHDRQHVYAERRDVHRAQYDGSRREVRKERGELHHARAELSRDQRDRRHAYVRRAHYSRAAYVGPSGYAYRPVAAGHRFDRQYYGQRYWVSDYGRYRLRSPGYGRRWVHYGNDVLLVDIRSGRVIAVRRAFFG